MVRKSSSKRRRNELADDATQVRAGTAQPRSSRVTSIADASLHELALQTMAALNATAVAIAIDDGGSMTCRARAGATAPEIGTPVQRDRGVTGECVRTGAVVRCDDALNDPRVDPEISQQLQIGSIVVAPLLRNGEVLGVVEAFFVLPNFLNDGDVEFLQRVAQQAATRVWGEEPSAPAADLNEIGDGTAVAAREEPTKVPLASHNDHESSVGEAAGGQPADADVSESQFDNIVPVDATVKPVPRGRTIAIALAALTAVMISAFLVARWHNMSIATTPVPAAQQSEQPPAAAAPDPLAELRRAAESGDAAAQYKLARAYKTGSGVKADPQQSNAWLRTAAEHGNPDAQFDWARAHEATDPVDAYTWYVIAGQNGKTESDAAIRRLTPKLSPAQIAQVRLEVGRHFLSGRALRRDPVTAYVWFRLAEWGGNTTAQSEMQHVKSELTTRQLRRAEARASEWIRRHTAAAARSENAAADVQQ